MKGFTTEKIGMLILGTLAAICIYVALTDSGCPHSKNTPTALDVYRGKIKKSNNMLTEKDYCDYDTCVALKELGFSEPTLAYYHGFLSSKPLLYLVIDEDCMPEDGVNIFDLLSNSNKYKDSKNIDAPTLWEAQKWLREVKDIHLAVYYGKGRETNRVWCCNLVMENKVRQLTYEGVLVKTFSSYEEALSEGIKEAVKILKGE